ncbi:hypothetical protein H9P43_002651 [Blastocladiella emersonii ATCC 22665]|nr:hypothetical protein H9P43_002651 [Blastocladiella emersonii ATCC 22665]
MLDDVAGLAGIAIPTASDAPSVVAAPSAVHPPLDLALRRIIDGSLEERQQILTAKELAILVDVQLRDMSPSLSMAAALFVTSDAGIGLRAVLAKAVAVGIGASLPLARGLILVTATSNGDLMGPASTARLEIGMSLTISRVALGCIDVRSASHGGGPAVPALAALAAARVGHDRDLDQSLGSRGSRFGNVALTYAALAQMVARMGGTVEQSMTQINANGGTELKLTIRIPIVSFDDLHVNSKVFVVGEIPAVQRVLYSLLSKCYKILDEFKAEIEWE